MSYCMFENTYRDLRDCYDVLRREGVHKLEKETNIHEKRYIQEIISLCNDIAEEFYEDEEIEG